jgi:hypothetical protein
MANKTIITPLLFGLCIGLLLFLFQFSFYVAFGLGWTVFLFTLFFQRLGESLPLLELMLLMAALQWIMGARIAYAYEAQHFKYYMYVPEADYMQLAVPGTFFFSLGVLFFAQRQSFNELNETIKRWLSLYPKAPYYLIIGGFIAVLSLPYIPTAFRFLFYLIGSFQYAGLALLLFQSNRNYNWFYFLIILGSLTITSIIRGLFHDLFLWSALMMSFVLLRNNWGWFAKMLIVTFGFLIAFLVQSVKAQYRENFADASIDERIGIFFNLTIDRIVNLNEVVNDEDLMDMINVRLNQGWIISAVINNVPDNDSFANGETIITALSASFIPRFLDPDKKEAGGRENFRRFTGLNLRDDTSMGTSVLGEAYANFGYHGAYLFMFIWGSILAITLNWLLIYAKNRPVLIVFLPLIYIQVLKAETELVVVLNHLIKSIILVLLFLWYTKNFLGWRLSVNDRQKP